ncbi:cytochrome P450 [Basidiobolus meristosporus CBS 931.73]|uniref:Cytochrome P450 n=1 Tax=Basidiobolus meristosporus CBS 931.73 TaxID=1314790 RepID=A0A1Y1Y7A4_9FUNG|nr:cytochrome P450 [Basidiobolus meristosporus CBS 931.73]|eukprot:ORX93775.1 cytochrome P450 [Basidiobolus meristosporus CBS 931.73]
MLTIERIKRYGTHFKFISFFIPYVFTSNPEDYRRVFSTENFPKASIYDEVGRFLGESGLITIQHSRTGGPWKKQRHLLNQAFKVSAVKTMQACFQRHASRFAMRLKGMVGEEVDMLEEVTTLTLNIIIDIIGAEEASKEFEKALIRIISDLSSPWLVIPYGGHYLRWKYRREFKIVNAYIYESIASYSLNRGKQPESEYKTLLKLMVDAEENGLRLTPTEIRNHLFAFLFAGHETTSNTLSWLIWELTRHPEVESKLVNEMVQHCSPLQIEVRQLEYFNQCINETLRMYPPVTGLSRRLDAPYQLHGTNILIPKGFDIQCDIFSIQRDPRYWTNPDAFVPERWESKEEPRHPSAYVPFSAGPRICIGKGFFLHEVSVIVHTLLVEGVRFAPSTQNVPGNGVVSSRTGLLKPQKVVVKIATA